MFGFVNIRINKLIKYNYIKIGTYLKIISNQKNTK